MDLDILFPPSLETSANRGLSVTEEAAGSWQLCVADDTAAGWQFSITD